MEPVKHWWAERLNFNPFNLLEVIDSEKELAELNTVIEIDPCNAEALSNRGLTRCKMQDLDGSLADLDKSIELDPKNPRTYFRRSYTNECRGDLRATIADLDKMIELEPTETIGYTNRAIYKVKLKDFAGAIADFSTAIDLEPDFSDYYHYRYLAKKEAGDHAGAKADFLQAQEMRFRSRLEWIKSLKPQMQKQETSESNQTVSHGTDYASRPLHDIRHHLNDVIDYLENHYKNKGLTGLTTGFKELDRLTGGLQPGSLNVIASRPSMGRTALAMNIAEHVAVNRKVPVVIFDAEMSTKMLVLRLLCSRARINLQSIRNGFLTLEDQKKLTKVSSEYMQSNLWIDDRGRPTVMDLEERVKSLATQHQLGLIVINTFESLCSPWRLPLDQHTAEMSVIAKGLKALARESKVPILVLARLSRDADDRENQMPILSGLSESGSLDLEADVVGLLYRADYYSMDPADKAERRRDAELIIAKNNHGPTGSVPLTFQSEYTRFESRMEFNQ